MSKLLTKDDKLARMKTMYKSFSKEQVEHLEHVENVDARYKCAQRYMREFNEGERGERKKALEYYRRYREILEGLDCIENKLWTNSTKIENFGRLLDAWGDKCVQLVNENNRRHLERLKLERSRHQKEYMEAQAKYDKQIAELEKELR